MSDLFEHWLIFHGGISKCDGYYPLKCLSYEPLAEQILLEIDSKFSLPYILYVCVACGQCCEAPKGGNTLLR